MLITIRNLPSSTRYTDLKALLLSQCGLVDGYVLDNLVADGTCKTVTVGLAEEDDAALLARKINGYNYKGNSLYVQDLKKNKKTKEQTYHTQSSDMGESSKIASYTIPSNTASQNTPMNQWMMSTPFYNMPTQNPYYTLPQQTTSVGYGSQQQQTMFQASQYQYPSQGSSQAPLGFRPEGSFSNMPWSQNQQTKNEKNYFMQDDSNRRPEKRSLDDRSGDNYSELAKKSRWDDPFKTWRSTHEERSRSDDRGWQVSGRGDDRGHSSNAYDYEPRNNDRKGADHSNDTNNFFYQSVEKGYYSDRSNEHKLGYNQPDGNRGDFTTFDENTGNFDRHFSTRNNYGQSTERDGKFNRDNGKERSLNKAERFYYDEESAQTFNKFHWPPLNTGTSNDSPSRSSELYGGQNSSRDNGRRRNKIRVWENSNHPFNNRFDSDSQSRSRKYGNEPPKTKPKVTNTLPMPAKPLTPGQVLSHKGSVFRRQAITNLANQVLRNVGCQAEEGTLLMKRLKESIARKVDIVTYNQEMPYREIVKRYRAIHVAANDHFFFKIILTQVQKEEAPTTVHIDVPDPISKRDKKLNYKQRSSLAKKAARKARRAEARLALREANASGQSSNKPPTEPTTKPLSTQESEPPSTQESEPPSTQESELPSTQESEPPSTQESELPSTQESEPLSAQLSKPSKYTPPSMFILPNHPKGDKQLFRQIKRQMNQELSDATEFELDPILEQAIDEELYPLVQFMKTVNISKSKGSDKIFKEIKQCQVPEECMKALKTQLSTRQWYKGPVSLRVFARPRMPNKTKLSRYLDKFGVISLKAAKKPGIMFAFCRNYQCYDKLLNKKDAVCEGSTLIFKPMKLVASHRKVKVRDINKFRRYYISSQIDNSDINILKNTDGKPYVLTDKRVKKVKNISNDGNKAVNESNDTADDAVTINEGAVQSSAMKEDVKEDGNICQLTEETTIDTKADCEIKDVEEPSSKGESNTDETSVLINKTHEKPAKNKNKQKKKLNNDNIAEPENTEHKNKPDDGIPDRSTNDEADFIIIDYDENGDGPSDVDLNLNEVDDDELEDY
ncbi:hypothetical protein K1T71_013861 [Dendrolimus kikuchii]|uniref:Uncharacterized protein n=1 Tax=Dendrolimus kikuchii TaxID=765133 RepID=A0ACC1CFX2_9NEOP|nr:hypothetical protein K1T71_013861 [Dendrolimus kikuchii]